MKKFALLLILISLHWTLAAQETFTKIISGGKTEEGISVIQTSDGGYAFLGTTVTLQPNDRWLVRTDPHGDTLWTRTYKDIGGTEFDDRSLVQTSDGGFTFLANHNGNASLLHISATGDSAWEKILYAGRGMALSVTSDKGYIVTGVGGTLMNDVVVCRSSSDGQVSWQKHFLANNASGVWTCSVREIPGNGYIIGGADESTFLEMRPFLLRISSAGDSLWTRFYGLQADVDLYSLDLTADNGFIGVGRVLQNSSFIMKLDSAGDTLWTRITDAHKLFSLRSTPDGGFVTCGSKHINDSVRVYIGKYSSEGECQWERAVVLSSPAAGYSIETTADHGYVICGQTTMAQDSSNAILIKVDGEGYAYGIGEHRGEGNITLYPNPASTFTSMMIGQKDCPLPVSLKIYDVSGKQVKTVEFPSYRDTYQLDVSELSDGIYMVTVVTPSDIIGKTKLIIRHGTE